MVCGLIHTHTYIYTLMHMQIVFSKQCMHSQSHLKHTFVHTQYLATRISPQKTIYNRLVASQGIYCTLNRTVRDRQGGRRTDRHTHSTYMQFSAKTRMCQHMKCVFFFFYYFYLFFQGFFLVFLFFIFKFLVSFLLPKKLGQTK